MSSGAPILIGILLAGFLAMALGVLGIVLLAKRYKNQDSGGRVLVILAMIGLVLFALGGVFAAGCSAIFLADSIH